MLPLFSSVNTPQPLFLFTMVSLVLAISGATYSALMALRSCLHETVRDVKNSSESCGSTFSKASDSADKKRGIRKNQIVRLGLHVWRWSIVVPIAVFAVVVFTLAFYTVSQDTFDPVSRLSWLFFRWLILSMAILDIVCFITALLGYLCLWFFMDDVEFHRYQITKGQVQKQTNKPDLVSDDPATDSPLQASGINPISELSS